MLVIEPSSQELRTEVMEIGQRSEDESATGHVVHPREVHMRMAIQLVKDCPLALVPLRDGSFGFTSALTEKGLKGVQHILMRRTPLFYDEQIFG